MLPATALSSASPTSSLSSTSSPAFASQASIFSESFIHPTRGREGSRRLQQRRFGENGLNVPSSPHTSLFTSHCSWWDSVLYPTGRHHPPTQSGTYWHNPPFGLGPRFCFFEIRRRLVSRFNGTQPGFERLPCECPGMRNAVVMDLAVRRSFPAAYLIGSRPAPDLGVIT